MDKQNKVTFKNLIGYLLLILIVLLSFSLTVLIYIDDNFIEMKKEELQINEESIVKLEVASIGKELKSIIADLHFLHHSFLLEEENKSDYELIAKEWKAFSDAKNIYDQLRFIDKDGNELIRINYDLDGAIIVEDSDLQNKSNRYYFYETIKLEDEYTYISTLDLNIENSEIELPIKPMIRFCTPVYNKDDELLGVIVINYLAENLINEFESIKSQSQGEVYLLNDEGYWISSSDTEQEWAFMYEDKKDIKFPNLFPDEWELIQDGRETFVTENGLFNYSEIILSDKTFGKDKIVFGDGKLKIISYVRNDEEFEYLFDTSFYNKIKRTIINNTLYFILVIISSLVASILIFDNKKSYLKIKFFSEYDVMTKTLNRRAGIALLNDMLTKNNRRKTRISICFIDVNGLKEVNDTLGHEDGDELLLTVVNCIKKIIRTTDYIARLGGDEFVIIFDNIDINEAEEVWKRIENEFDKINENEDRKYLVSVSHGIAEYDKQKNILTDELISLADERMYEEKRVMKKNIKILRN